MAPWLARLLGGEPAREAKGESSVDRTILQTVPSPEGDLAPETAARQRLLQRVRHSVERHQPYRTVRREDCRWQSSGEGRAHTVLHRSEGFEVSLLRLDAGARLGQDRGDWGDELLVLGGGFGPGRGRWSHATRRPQDDFGELVAVEPTQLYRRRQLLPDERLAPLERRWWAGPTRWVDAGRRAWRANGPGVEVLPLRGDADVVSMLVRFAAGASVQDHRHELDEDCLVLEGDMFLGDILLREGDYQLAPAGGSHFGECSEPGVTFFFHGALDPVLRVP